MGFTSGTTSTVLTNCAKSFIDTLDTFMQSNGYSLIETYPNSTDYGKVWKSAAADNGSVDFYISAYTATLHNSSVYFGLAEDYNATTHKLLKYVPYTGSGKTVSQTDYTVQDSTGYLLSAYTSYYGVVQTISGWSYNYWFSVNPHRIHLSTRVGITEHGVFLGQCENLIPTSLHPTAAVCLAAVAGQMTGARTQDAAANAQYCGFTREPGQANTAVGNWGAYMLNTSTWPSYGGAFSYDSVYRTGRPLQRIPIFSNRDNTSLYIPRALMPFGHYTQQQWVTVCGDEMVANGKTYVRMTLGNTATHQLWVDDSL